MTINHRLILAALAWAWISLTAAPLSAEEPQHQNSFKVVLIGAANVSGRVAMKLESESEYRYTWIVNGPERTLVYDSSHAKVMIDGKQSMLMTADRQRYMVAQDGITKVEADFEHAPERIRDMMRSCYELPICKLTVDASGRETRREVVATAPAKAILVDNGAITNALIFHPPYHTDENQWQAPAAMSIGGVNVVEGDLTFTRSPGKDGQDGLATFAVAGTLTKAQVTKPGSPFVEKGIRHVVTGKQAYDPALREWAWGSWTIDTSSQTFANGEQAGAMQGTIQVRFERLAAAPTTKPK